MKQILLEWCTTELSCYGKIYEFKGEHEKMKIEFAPIGIIHSPFMEPEGMPIQPAGAAGVSHKPFDLYQRSQNA